MTSSRSRRRIVGDTACLGDTLYVSDVSGASGSAGSGSAGSAGSGEDTGWAMAGPKDGVDVGDDGLEPLPLGLRNAGANGVSNAKSADDDAVSDLEEYCSESDEGRNSSDDGGSDDEKSGSETYYNDFGGDVWRDEDWEGVRVTRRDVELMYDSDDTSVGDADDFGNPEVFKAYYEWTEWGEEADRYFDELDKLENNGDSESEASSDVVSDADGDGDGDDGEEKVQNLEALRLEFQRKASMTAGESVDTLATNDAVSGDSLEAPAFYKGDLTLADEDACGDSDGDDDFDVENELKRTGIGASLGNIGEPSDSVDACGDDLTSLAIDSLPPRSRLPPLATLTANDGALDVPGMPGTPKSPSLASTPTSSRAPSFTATASPHSASPTRRRSRSLRLLGGSTGASTPLGSTSPFEKPLSRSTIAPPVPALEMPEMPDMPDSPLETPRGNFNCDKTAAYERQSSNPVTSPQPPVSPVPAISPLPRSSLGKDEAPSLATPIALKDMPPSHRRSRSRSLSLSRSADSVKIPSPTPCGPQVLPCARCNASRDKLEEVVAGIGMAQFSTAMSAAEASGETKPQHADNADILGEVRQLRLTMDMVARLVLERAYKIRDENV